MENERTFVLLLTFAKTEELSVMDNIIRKMKVYYPVSDRSLDIMKSYFRRQVFPAKAIIMQAGRFDRQVYFIEKGITRAYILHEGKEITTWFSAEGDATCGS